MTGTFWAILPPVIAIVLALITKEVYLSLMIGIASGALMYHNFHLIKAMDTIFAIMGQWIPFLQSWERKLELIAIF